MNEQEWLECNRVWPVWERARKRDSRRKFRLFLVACCRRVWHIMTDSRCRRAVEVAERFSDGAASIEELSAAGAAVRVRGRGTTGYLARCVTQESPGIGACDAACRVELRHAGRDPRDGAASAAVEAEQVKLLRDILGNPFHPLPFLAPSVLGWNGSTVVKLAQSTYQERKLPEGTLDPVRLAVLADALEEAGCTSKEFLVHLRGPGAHVRGCWALDCVVGKE